MEDCNPDEMYSRAVLGVGLNASRKDIESAFRRKALHCHPDKLNLTKGSDEYLKATDVFLDLNNAKDYLLAMLVKPLGDVSEEQEQASQNHQNDEYQHKGVGIGERNGPYTNGEWRADKDFRWDEELGVFKSPNGKTFYCEKFDAENFMWKYSPEKDLYYRVQRLNSGSKPSNKATLNEDSCFPEALFQTKSTKPSTTTKTSAASKKKQRVDTSRTGKRRAQQRNEKDPYVPTKQTSFSNNDKQHKPSSTTNTSTKRGPYVPTKETSFSNNDKQHKPYSTTNTSTKKGPYVPTQQKSFSKNDEPPKSSVGDARKRKTTSSKTDEKKGSSINSATAPYMIPKKLDNKRPRRFIPESPEDKSPPKKLDNERPRRVIPESPEDESLATTPAKKGFDVTTSRWGGRTPTDFDLGTKEIYFDRVPETPPLIPPTANPISNRAHGQAEVTTTPVVQRILDILGKQLSCVIDQKCTPVVEFVPKEIFTLTPEEVNLIDAKKDLAAKDAIASVMKRMQEDYGGSEGDDGSVDSDDSFIVSKYPFSQDQVKDWFDSLKKCHAYILGFAATPGTNDKKCWCPCCDKGMKPWQEDCKVDYIAEKCKKSQSNGSKDPQGLLDHLEKMGKTCLIHYGVNIYLRNLYKDPYGTEVGHWALYKPSDSNYRIAVAAGKKAAAQKKLAAEEELNGVGHYALFQKADSNFNRALDAAKTAAEEKNKQQKRMAAAAERKATEQEGKLLEERQRLEDEAAKRSHQQLKLANYKKKMEEEAAQKAADEEAGKESQIPVVPQPPTTIPNELSVGAPVANPGVCCYVNSTFQALAHCPELCDSIRASFHVEKCRNAGTPFVTRAVEEFISLIHQQPAPSTAINNSSFYEQVLPVVLKHDRECFDYDEEQHQDASEFLLKLLGSMETEWNKEKNDSTANIIDQFRCSYSYTRLCNACNHTETATHADCLDIVQLLLEKEKIIEFEIDQHFFEKKEYEGQCDNCGKTTNKTQSKRYDRLPNIIPVFLQRIMIGKKGNQIKVTKKCDFPIRLQIKNCAGNPSSTEIIYNLSGVVVHQGRTIKRGHYYTLVRDMSKQIGTTVRWWKLDDEIQKELPETEVLKAQASILLYSSFSRAEDAAKAKDEAAQMAKQKEEAARKAEQEQAAKDAVDVVKAKDEAARMAKQKEEAARKAKEEAARMEIHLAILRWRKRRENKKAEEEQAAKDALDAVKAKEEAARKAKEEQAAKDALDAAKAKDEAAQKAKEEEAKEEAQAAKDALDAAKAKDEAAQKAKEEEAKEEAAQMANQSPVRNLWGAFKTAVFGKKIETSPPALPALQKVQEEAQQDENEKQRTKAAEIMIESSDEDSIDDGYDEEEWKNVALPPGWLKFQCKRTASDFYTYESSINATVYKTWYHPSSTSFLIKLRKRWAPERFASKLRNKCMFEGAFDWETCGAEAGACFDTVPYSDGLFFNGPLTISVPLDDKQEDGSDEDSTVTDEDDEEDDGLFNESDAEPGGDIFYIVQLPYDFKDHSTPLKRRVTMIGQVPNDVPSSLFKSRVATVEPAAMQLMDSRYEACYCHFGSIFPRSHLFRNVGDQIVSVNSESMRGKSFLEALRFLMAAMESGKESCSPIVLKMRDIIASHQGHHPSYETTHFANHAKLAAVVRKDFFPVLRRAMVMKLSSTFHFDEIFEVSSNHPLYALWEKFGDNLTISIVHVRDQLMDDGLMEYNELLRDSEMLLRRRFTDGNKNQIALMRSQKSTILLSICVRGDKSRKRTPITISALFLHLFQGKGGYISFGASHAGRLSDEFHSSGDKASYQGRGVFKALILLASDVCLAGSRTRTIMLQTRDNSCAKSLFLSMGFSEVTVNSDESTRNFVRVLEETKPTGPSLSDPTFLQDGDSLKMYGIARRPRLCFNFGMRLVQWVEEQYLPNEDADVSDNYMTVDGEFNAPVVSRRSSPRIIEYRMTQLSQGRATKSGSNRICVTEFRGIRYVKRQDRWFGWFGHNVKRRYEEVEVCFVERNFSSTFITECMKNPGSVINVPASAPKHRPPPDEFRIQTNIPVYQQLHRDTCVASALASAFRYFNDEKAHRIMKEYINRSANETDRLQQMESMLVNRNLRYRVEKFGKEATFRKEAVHKRVKRTLNIFENISCYPTVVVLRGSDGSVNHAVTVVGTWVFDSNVAYAQPLTLPLLDWCCSTDTVRSNFVQVHYAMRFFPASSKIIRKEWNICDSCRNMKKPCLMKFQL